MFTVSLEVNPLKEKVSPSAATESLTDIETPDEEIDESTDSTKAEVEIEDNTEQNETIESPVVEESSEAVESLSDNENTEESEDDDEDDDLSLEEVLEEASESFASLNLNPNIYDLIAMESNRKYAREAAKENRNLDARVKTALKRMERQIKKCKNLAELKTKANSLEAEIAKYNSELEKMKNLLIDYNAKNITKQEFTVGMQDTCSILNQQLGMLQLKDFVPRGTDSKITDKDLEALKTFARKSRELIAARRLYLTDKNDRRTREEKEIDAYESCVTAATGCGDTKCDESDMKCLEGYDENDPILEVAYHSYLNHLKNCECAEEGVNDKGKSKRKPLTKKQYFIAMCRAKKIKNKEDRKATMDGIGSGNYTVDDAEDAGLLNEKKSDVKADESCTRKDGMKVMTSEDEKKKKEKDEKKNASESFMEFLDSCKIEEDDGHSDDVSTDIAEEGAGANFSIEKSLLAKELTSLKASVSSDDQKSVANKAQTVLNKINFVRSLAEKLEDPEKKEKELSALKEQEQVVQKINGRANTKAAKESVEEYPDWSDIDIDNNVAEEAATKEERISKSDTIVQKVENKIKDAEKLLKDGKNEEAINTLRGAKADCKDIDGDESKFLIEKIDNKIDSIESKEDDDSATESLDWAFNEYLKSFGLTSED